MGVQKYPYLARDLRNTGWLFGYIVEHGLSFVKAAREIVDVFFQCRRICKESFVSRVVVYSFVVGYLRGLIVLAVYFDCN